MPQNPSKSEIEEVVRALEILQRKEREEGNSYMAAFFIGAKVATLWLLGESPRNDIVTDAELNEALGYVPK